MTRTLYVHIGTTPDSTDIEETLADLDAGEAVDSQPARLTVESLATFGRIFRPTNLELLKTLARHDPESIRELARIVDRHPPEVTENINELADYGLVELKDNGRAKRPTLWYDEIEVSGDISLQDVDGGSGVEAAP